MQRLSHLGLCLVAALLATTMATTTYAQDGERPRGQGREARPGGERPQGERPQGERPQGGERGRQAPGAAGPGGAGAPGDMVERMLRNDPSPQFIGLLSELNMTPEFTLTAEQKRKIQTLREQFRSEREGFVANNRRQIDFIRGQMDEAREARNREAMAEAFDSLRDLVANGPTGEKLIEDIKATLTADQKRLVEERQAQREERIREMREQREQRTRPREGGGGARGGQQGPDI